MIVMPYGIEHAHHVWRWRLASREALRTPYMQNHDSQIEYARWVGEHPEEVRMWAMFDDAEELRYEPMAVAGLERIEWENGTAEISLIVNSSMRQRGCGWAALCWLFAEAFDRMRLHSVWSETYHCNDAGIAIASKAIHTFDGEVAILPRRKFWNGSYWSSRWWCIFEEGWNENRHWDPSTDGIVTTSWQGDVPACQEANPAVGGRRGFSDGDGLR